jgi:hypothetical protein
VLSKSTWAVLGLTLDIELFTQTHYRSSIEPDSNLSELWRDVFLFHWKEESQHAILDELEWHRENAKLTPDERNQAVTDLIELVAAVDGILQMQAKADADYFLRVCRRTLDEVQAQQLRDTTRMPMLVVHCWANDERFQRSRWYDHRGAPRMGIRSRRSSTDGGTTWPSAPLSTGSAQAYTPPVGRLV